MSLRWKKTLRVRAFLLLLLLAGAAIPLRAQAGAGSPPKPRVRSVTVLDWLSPQEQADAEKKSQRKARTEAGLNDWIVLDVENIDPLITKAGGQPLMLYINGLPLKGLTPYQVDRDARSTRLRFLLERTDDSTREWYLLLGRPGARFRTVHVTVGVPDCGVGCTDIAEPATMDLIIIRPGWLITYTVLIALLLFALFKYGSKSGLLRDPGPEAPHERPFSLGRTQMAFWFLLVIAAFCFIWVVTGSLSSLTTDVLTLMGISAGTGLASVLVDNSKRTTADDERNRLRAESASLEARLPEIRAALPQATDPVDKARLDAEVQRIVSRLAEINVALQLPPSAEEQPPRGFWRDILSDGSGISLHRFQIAVWTAVLGLIFVATVYVQLSMPDLNDQLLLLMGISSGTYLGFKFPEKQA
jgi:hypothetical protein